MRPITSDDWMGEVIQSKLGFKTDNTTEWIGNYTPYQCGKCGHYVDSKTKYCPECGRKATNYEN